MENIVQLFTNTWWGITVLCLIGFVLWFALSALLYKIFFKKFYDILFSGLALIALSPLFLVISIIIKITSKGPVFFKQERLGKNGKIFKIIKFRTMVINAEQIGDRLFVFTEQDARITKFGKFLRKTSLDEIPQLFNILKKDMSIIGPRPPVLYHPYKTEEYPDWSKPRFNVRPGITGLSQVKFRNSVPWDERIKLDVKYAQELSIWLDIKIFILTIKTVLFTKNQLISRKDANNNKGSINEIQ